jgi:hypothetical protein
LIVYVLEWGLLGNKNVFHVEAICATYELAAKQANCGRYNEEPEVKFTEAKEFFNLRRWEWKGQDGEMYRIREFEVEVE